MNTSVKKTLVTLMLASGFAASAQAQIPNSPEFSLWITEVNGVPCASCPTQHLPHTEVQPGDRLTVEVSVAGWDDNPGAGRCDGDPIAGQAGNCTNIGGGCPGQHCISNGMQCASLINCGGAPCVQNVCQPYPRAGAYTATILVTSFQTGAQGSLGFAQIACSIPDCLDSSSPDCTCNHGYTSPAQCTCAQPNLCGVSGFCSLSNGTTYIAKAEPNFLFWQRASMEIVFTTSFFGAEFSSYLLSPLADGVSDSGQRAVIGTLLLDSSGDAMGQFTLGLWNNPNTTFLLGANALEIGPATIQDATITFPCLEENCVDDNPCTIDNCDADGVTCRHDPIVCPVGESCFAGTCRRVIRAIPTKG